MVQFGTPSSAARAISCSRGVSRLSHSAPRSGSGAEAVGVGGCWMRVQLCSSAATASAKRSSSPPVSCRPVCSQQTAQMRGEPRPAQVEHEGGDRPVLGEIIVRRGIAACEAETLQKVLVQRQRGGRDEQRGTNQQRDEVTQQRRAPDDIGGVTHVDEAHEPARGMAARSSVLGELVRARMPEIVLRHGLAHEVIERAAIHRQDARSRAGCLPKPNRLIRSITLRAFYFGMPIWILYFFRFTVIACALCSR